jgi:hypothetical protein
VSLVETIREHVRENGSGMVSDLLFALVWVTIVEVFFTCVVAYFGFFWSLDVARERA